MKITGVETSLLRAPSAPPVSKQYPEHAVVAATIQTDEGVTGLGYTMLVGGAGAEAVRAYLEARLRPLLIGADPFQVNGLWQQMYRQDMGIRKKGVPVYAISAIDIGLWDLIGKASGQPLYRLLGAGARRVPVYGSGGFLPYTVDEIVKEAQSFLDRGCRAFKMKIGLPDLRANVERVRAVRQALGDGIGLMVDANQRWDVLTNVRVARLIEPYDIYWYEEPVPADNIGQCAEVARQIGIPVATGENEYTRYGFRDLIEQRAAAYLQPDVHRAGGIGEMLRIAHLAAAYDLPIAPHLAPELSVHILAAIPNPSLAEWVNFLPDDLFLDPLPIVDGQIALPDRPGHGVAFSPEALRRYRVG